MEDANTYTDAAHLFHELNAHIANYEAVETAVKKELENPDNTKKMDELRYEISHGKSEKYQDIGYGSYSSGFKEEKLKPGTPADIINKELSLLQAHDILLKQRSEQPLPKDQVDQK